MADRVRAKKSLGQHFLVHQPTAERIVSLLNTEGNWPVVEIGPGMGVLTGHLHEIFEKRLWMVEIDDESVAYLKTEIPAVRDNLIHGDFLKLDLSVYFPEGFSVVGNFPYNISSQILFKVLEYRGLVYDVVGMFQREVARRLVAHPGSKEYGILSVLMDAFFERHYEFTVSEQLFKPPPKVKSAVVRFVRKPDPQNLGDEKRFIQLVKAAFNQRRKTLRNSLSQYWDTDLEQTNFGSQRAEQLDYRDFLRINELIAQREA